MYLRYLKHSVWNFLLSCLMAWCLVQMCLRGFYVSPGQMGNQRLIVGVILVVAAALWLLNFGKKTKIACVIGFVAAVIAAFLYIRMKGELILAFTDSVENPYLFYMICLAVTIGVWLLAATRRGTFVLFVLGFIVEALIHFLYDTDLVICLVLFLAGCMINLALQNYRLNLAHTKGVKTGFVATALVSCILTLILVLIGSVAFYGIVRPLDPPTKELYLVEKDVSHTVVDRIGLAKEVQVPDPNLKSEKTEENQREARNPDGSKGKQEEPDGNQKETKAEKPEDKTVTELDEQNEENTIDAIRYPLPKNLWWLPLVIIAAIIAAVVILKILSRKWWLSNISKKSRKEQVSKMYHRFLFQFKMLKEGKNPEETPYEYVSRAKVKLSDFAIEETNFEELTDIFVRSGYGDTDVPDESYAKYLAFYKKIYGKLRQYLGLRWIYMFFVL